MGWNEARLSLLPTNWTQHVEQIQSCVSVESRVRVARSVRTSRAAEPLVPDLVARWLVADGFVMCKASALDERFIREDIEAEIFVVGEEVSGILLTFLLTRESPSHWQAWRSLVERLCEEFTLCPFDTELSEKRPASEALRILAMTQSWKEFQSAFGWPAVPGAEGR